MLIIAGPSITMKIAGNRQKISGKRIFTGTFRAELLGTLAAPDAHLLRLLPQHVGNRHAELAGLHDDRAERPQLDDVGAPAQSSQRFDPR